MAIYSDIRDRIHQKEYALNDKLPDGDSLALKYGCSKLTVKKALDMLVQEGMVMRRRGAGTFVKSYPFEEIQYTISPNRSLLDVFGKDKISSKVILFSIEKAPMHIAEKLKIIDEYIYKIIRVREVNGTPISIEHTYMPLSIIPNLEAKHLEDSIYNFIRNELNLKIHSAHIWVKGDHSNQEDTLLLKLSEPTFVMEVEKQGYLENGKIFEYSTTRHRHEYFKFETFFIQN